MITKGKLTAVHRPLVGYSTKDSSSANLFHSDRWRRSQMRTTALRMENKQCRRRSDHE